MAYLQLLLAPAFAVMGIAFLFSLMLQKFATSQLREVAFGLMFGGTIILGMVNPLEVGDGIIFDTRSLLLAAAVAFAGPVAGLIALGMGLACRFYIGGFGMGPGLLGLVLAYLLAFATEKWIRPQIHNQVVADIVLGLMLMPTVLVLLLLPLDLAKHVLSAVLPSLFISNVAGMVVMGLIFRRAISQEARRLELEEQATRDPLTNLLNRRGLETVARGRSFDPRVGQAMLYFDVDNFKTINDRHGHDIGDAVLEVIAKRINENLRGGAIFARQGGDEFSVYMPDVAEKDVPGIANRICALVSDDELAVEGLQIKASISMGAYWSRSNLGLEELIRRADAQLLLAKQAGKNRAQVAYDPKSTLVSVA